MPLPDALKNASTTFLERYVYALEQSLIRGTASGEDIDIYISVQLELAERNPFEPMLDPRD